MDAGVRGPGARPATRTGTQPLKSLLWKWERAQPARRNLIIAYIREDLLIYKQAILDSIKPTSPYCISAIQLAGRLRLLEALSDIHQLSRNGEPEVRAAAIEALNRMERMTDEQILTYLEDRAEPPLLATLAICAERDRPPVMKLLDFLTDHRAKVREAAYKALPETLDKEAQDRVRELLRIARPEVATLIMRVIGDTRGFEEGEATLLQRVQSSKWNVRIGALDALGRSGQRIGSTAEIRRYFSKPTTSVEEKVACLMAFERTRTIDHEWLAQINAATPHPVVRLHVARCYVRDGDAKGARLLIDLLKVQEGGDIDDETADYVRHAARKILAEIAGEDHGESPVAWERIADRMKDHGPMVIQFRPWKHW